MKYQKYKNPIHSLISSGGEDFNESWQENIITYLSQKCSAVSSLLSSPQTLPFTFSSPLPVNLLPNSSLFKELLKEENGDTPLRLAIRMHVPNRLVAALCQLCPRAASIPDSSGAIPLHLATLIPNGWSIKKEHFSQGNEEYQLFEILIETFPGGIIWRDDTGKTPLHWLLENYAESRSVAIVEILSRSVDEKVWREQIERDNQTRHKKNIEVKGIYTNTKMIANVAIPIPSIMIKSSLTLISSSSVKEPRDSSSFTTYFTPASALVIPECCYGCIPLHYAVMNGATKEVMKKIVKLYPASVVQGDKLWRTSLHWYLGASRDTTILGRTGNITEKKKIPLHHTHLSSSIISTLLHIDEACNYEVGRIQDLNNNEKLDRTSLHWAVELIVKGILDPPYLRNNECKKEENTSSRLRVTEIKTECNETSRPNYHKCISLRALQLIVDSYPCSLLIKDANGHTPLHVLFNVAHRVNVEYYNKICDMIHAANEKKSVLKNPTKFSPPETLLQILLQSVSHNYEGSFGVLPGRNPQSKSKLHQSNKLIEVRHIVKESDIISDSHHSGNTPEDNYETKCAAFVKDNFGMLPIHHSALVICTANITRILLDRHPTSLISVISGVCDKDENNLRNLRLRSGMTPLHVAFAYPFEARLHSLETIIPFLDHESPLRISGKEIDVNESDNYVMKRQENLNKAKTQITPVDPTAIFERSTVLRIEDSGGFLPIHLAAINHASIDIIKMLLNIFPAGALSKTKSGDLPLHCLLDKKHLFVNVKLALAQGAEEKVKIKMSKNERNLFKVADNREHRDKVKELAKKQLTVMRMAQYNLGGAIFAPTEGWISDEEEVLRQKKRGDLLKKINLLTKPLVRDISCLSSASSSHGLLPIHIVIAFHAVPYNFIRDMLHVAPQSPSCHTVDGYSALDLHYLRRKIPGEIVPEEREAWNAIRELLFSYELFPLKSLSMLNKSSLYRYRTDRELINNCVRSIIAESKRDYHYCIHQFPPRDPMHEKLGFFEEVQIEGKSNFSSLDDVELKIMSSLMSKPNYRNTNNVLLTDAVNRLWIFLVTFINENDNSDHYAVYVQKILDALPFQTIESLVNRSVPNYGPGGGLSAPDFTHEWNLRECANIYCKAVIHTFFLFAGLYDFTPTRPEYDTLTGGCGPSILIHRGRGGRTLLLKAIEYTYLANSILFTGDKNNVTQKELNPKKAEGIRRVVDTKSNIYTRLVCIKFFVDKQGFEREIKIRSQMGISINNDENYPIVPILANYNATNPTDFSDRKFASDIYDGRFDKIQLYSFLQNHIDGSSKVNKEYVKLSGYPYAVVLPLSTLRNLYDSFLHKDIDSDGIRDVCFQIGSALKFVHSKELSYSSFSLRNFVYFTNDMKKKVGTWKMIDFSSAIFISPSSFHLGGIIPNSDIFIETSTFPPEMFTKLDKSELYLYEKYWEKAKNIVGSNVNFNIIKPWIDAESGDSYVLKCYLNYGKNDLDLDLPPLPYKLVHPSESVDIWSFGAALFKLLSGGIPLFQENVITGCVINYKAIASWNIDASERLVHQYVKDEIAQDLLLHILVPSNEREGLDMHTVLSHPFFRKVESLSSGVKNYLMRMKDKSKAQRESRKEQMEKEMQKLNQEIWIKSRMINVTRLGLKSQMKIMYSTTELIKKVFNVRDNVPTIPFCHVILPYKLVRNKSGRLTPATKKDVELAEKLGKQMLDLSKVCRFVLAMDKLLNGAPQTQSHIVKKWAIKVEEHQMKSSEDILLDLKLDVADFSELGSRLVSMIALVTDQFLFDPLRITRNLVQEFTSTLVSIYEESKKAYLYLVDEYYGIPVVLSNKDAIYPITITDHISQVVHKSLPFMHLCMLQMRGASKSISGLVRMIFEGAYPYIPPSWGIAAHGLTHAFDEKIISEVRILLQSISEMEGVKVTDTEDRIDEVYFIQDFLEYKDKNFFFSDLKCITDGHSFLWTTEMGVKEIKKDGSFENISSSYYEQEYLINKIKEKENIILKLEKKLSKR